MATTGELPSQLPHLQRPKLRPPRLGEGLVARPRLTDRLVRVPQAPLTLISAPAGFGKTTLLAEWTASLATPVAWLTVDPGDRELLRFVSYVSAAIATVVPELGVHDAVRDVSQSTHPASADERGQSLADALLDLPHDVVLVLDDYHLAASSDVENFIGGLLHFMPPALHLVLATRNDPALPLARMRLHGQIIEVRGDDLRFTDEEAGALLAAAGRAGNRPVTAALLRESTGGWAAGLRLVTLALPASDDPTRIQEAISGDQHLMDFLIEEVLSRQPRDVQDFLLYTAIVDRLSAPLADALIAAAQGNDSRMLLETLAREGLFFAPEGDDGVWFRHRPLFSSLLRHKLESRYPAPALEELHARAACWFAAHGEIEDAIRHFRLAGDEGAASSLVQRNTQAALEKEDWPAVATWLQMLPAALIQENPNLLLAKALVAHLSGRFASVREILDEVRGLLDQAQDASTVDASLRAECDALELGQTLVIGQDPQTAVGVACAAAERVPADHRFVRGISYVSCGLALQSAGRTEEAIVWLFAVANREAERIDAGSIRALMGLMFVHRQAGNYFECRQVTSHMRALALRHQLPVSAGWAHWALGWIAYERNELETAIAHFGAIATDRKRLHLGCVGDGMFGLALAYQASGMPLEAAATVHQLTETVLDLHSLAYLPSIRLFEARLALLRGTTRPTLESISASDGSFGDTSLVTFDNEVINRVRVLIADGAESSLAKARHDLAGLRAAAEAGCHRARLVEILALTALVHEACGQHESALAHLRQSVAIGEAAGFCRSYVDLGPSIAPLLRQLAGQSVQTTYLQRLVATMDAGQSLDRGRGEQTAPESPVHALDLLTLRETEVLEALRRRLSYQEIAQELFISINTVKSHTTHIYEKLGVENRRQALSKAESLGLLTQQRPAYRVI